MVYKFEWGILKQLHDNTNKDNVVETVKELIKWVDEYSHSDYDLPY
jgi:hypothetical protein